MTQISTHVLDTSSGRPAAGVPVELQARGPKADWAAVAHAVTDQDGRAGGLDGAAGVSAGLHRLVFDTAGYLRRAGAAVFFPEVVITFEVGTEPRLHLPLLLSPFGYTVYRGS